MIPFETLMMILVLVVMTATCLAAWKINKWLFGPLAAITLSMFIYTYDDTVHKEHKIQTLTKSFDAQLPILCQQNGEKYLIDRMRGWKRTHDHFLSPKNESIEINPRGCDVITQEREHYLLEAFVLFWLWIIAIVIFQTWKMYQMIMNSQEDKEQIKSPSPDEDIKSSKQPLPLERPGDTRESS
ncbi:MAG: hypothetical protein M1300_06085 [Epsilonproteobacteria bacterium]|jgi:hypothetical protein|nr:hypothetical protein [Campylobacterota bacterium]